MDSKVPQRQDKQRQAAPDRRAMSDPATRPSPPRSSNAHKPHSQTENSLAVLGALVARFGVELIAIDRQRHRPA
jgi:hypothetical protein